MDENKQMVSNFQIREDFFEQLMDMLEAQFGASTEIVLHDMRKKYDRTIVDIRNGHITGRKIGGFGSNLGLKVLKGVSSDKGDKYNYITKLENGHVLRSSSLYFRDDKGGIVGSLCINTDITETLRIREYLREYNHYEDVDEDDTEFFADNVENLLGHMIQQSTNKIGKSPDKMTKDEKKEFLHSLDKKGLFLISKSSERVQEYLNISKFTFYKWLDEVRSEL